MQTLRQQLILKRNLIPAYKREQYAHQAWVHLHNWPHLYQFQSIACYLPVNGEFPTQAIIQGLQSIHKNIYLPIVHKKSQSLSFQHYQSQTPMRRNTFGIAEPIPNAKKQILLPQLDLVIMPLTGFDFKGNRIGMGGGYYDRSFEFLLKHSNTPKPFMLGLGYQVQKSNNIIPQHWDVPLNGILTEATLIRIK